MFYMKLCRDDFFFDNCAYKNFIYEIFKFISFTLKFKVVIVLLFTFFKINFIIFLKLMDINRF